MFQKTFAKIKIKIEKHTFSHKILFYRRKMFYFAGDINILGSIFIIKQ